MKIAMFEGFDGATRRIIRRRLSGFGAFGTLTSSQMALADDALAAARAGRSAWEFWKPSIEELEAERGWLGDERVGSATLTTFLQKCQSVAGPGEWAKVELKWKDQIDAAQEVYDDATQRKPIVENPLGSLETIAKWTAIGLVAYVVLRGMKYLPEPKRRKE